MTWSPRGQTLAFDVRLFIQVVEMATWWHLGEETWGGRYGMWDPRTVELLASYFAGDAEIILCSYLIFCYKIKISVISVWGDTMAWLSVFLASVHITWHTLHVRNSYVAHPRSVFHMGHTHVSILFSQIGSALQNQLLVSQPSPIALHEWCLVWLQANTRSKLTFIFIFVFVRIQK